MVRKSFTPEDGCRAADLLQYARDHLFSAGLLYPHGARCLDSASSLSHVAVELLLKAVLLNETGSFPNCHRLTILYEAVRAAAPHLQLEPHLVRILPMLDQLFLARYPNPQGLPAVAQGDWPVIQHVASHIESWLPEEIRVTPNSDQAKLKGRRTLMNPPKE